MEGDCWLVLMLPTIEDRDVDVLHAIFTASEFLVFGGEIFGGGRTDQVSSYSHQDINLPHWSRLEHVYCILRANATRGSHSRYTKRDRLHIQ